MQDWSWLDTWMKTAPRKNPGTSTVTQPNTVTNPSGTLTLNPGYTPDYKALIEGDSGYLASLNSTRQDVAGAASARQAALRTLAMRYGGLPSGFKDTYGDIDPATVELAKGNQYSQVANLDRAYNDNVLATKRSLAARGALQSGELGYGLDRANLARAQGEYDLGNAFSDAANSAVTGYLAAEQAARKANADALAVAEKNVYANPANRPVDAVTANLDPDWSKWGYPVYVGPDGKRYKADGTPAGDPQDPYIPGSEGSAPAPAVPAAPGVAAGAAAMPPTPSWGKPLSQTGKNMTLSQAYQILKGKL